MPIAELSPLRPRVVDQEDVVDLPVQQALHAFRQYPRALKLRGMEMAYEWGDDEFIARLLGKPGRSRIAELWMGAHPGGPSTADLGGARVSLRQLIQALPMETLGQSSAVASGGLPYLFKVLSAAKPLSIQAHPNKAQAVAGFRRETQSGKPLQDPTRNYKDDNHKPELICAVTDFYALRGFRPWEELTSALQSTPELHAVAAALVPTQEGLRDLYTRIMRWGQPEVDGVLSTLVERLARRNQQRPFTPDEHEHWLLSADRSFSGVHKDRGLFSVLLLNLVHLHPGQAMFLPAGELHAYLQGTGMEVMASSDNVLRGGLTPKHVDVEELLGVLTFGGGRPEILTAQPTGRVGETVYATPAREFELRCITLAPGQTCARPEAPGPEIVVVTEGDGSVLTAQAQVRMERGEILFVPAGLGTTVTAGERMVAYVAGLPRPT